MLTKIEIDGFKTFKDFQVELAPFQVIVGPNGSGKSNLFDALQLLSRLADKDLATAFQDLRGNAGELFTKYPDGKTSDKIRIAIEMLVDREVEDDLGGKAELKYTRLRYEVEVTLIARKQASNTLTLTHESLSTLPQGDDLWCQKNNIPLGSKWRPDVSNEEFKFISTTSMPMRMVSESSELDKQDDYYQTKSHKPTPPIHLYRESDGTSRRISAEGARRTILSSINDIGYIHALAVRKELLSLKFLHLQPEALRQASSITGPSTLDTDGSNLPATLARMQAEDEFALTRVSRYLLNLVSSVYKISVKENTARNEYDIWAETSDKRVFSAQVLSDGTLRMLALATLSNDPHFHGLLCLEELENGVPPLHMNKMLLVLRSMVTDFSDPQQIDEPLQQVLLTTHSPILISQPAALNSLLFVFMTTYRQGKNIPPFSITRMVPVITTDLAEKPEDRALEAYTIDMVRKFLDRDIVNEAEEQLKKAKFSLYER